MMQNIHVRAGILSLVILTVLLGLWELINQPPKADKPQTEYEILMGGSEPQARVPNPTEIGKLAVEELSHPFYDICFASFCMPHACIAWFSAPAFVSHLHVALHCMVFIAVLFSTCIAFRAMMLTA